MSDYGNMLGSVLAPSVADKDGFIQGVKNLSALPELDSGNAVPGKPFEKGVMGLRTSQKGLRIAIACGKMQVRYIPLEKYVALVEKMHDSESASIILQNFTDQEDGRMARGQVLSRINPKFSAMTVIQGVTGRIVRGPHDIALYDVYYLDKKDLMAFYITAKFQLSNEDQLDSMIAAYDGWKAFNVPLNPLDPYGEGDE
jgi:hypothetical protein